MFQLKDLLPDALCRGRISRGVAMVKMVETFNDLMMEKLPPTRKDDVQALSFKDGVINTSCKNNLAMHWLMTRERELIDELSRRTPGARITKINSRLQN
ncbi:MAG: hypothetical protein V1716_00110 [Candidatus Uhrbacteria bacterium]